MSTCSTSGLDFRSEMNGFGSDNDLILPLFYISGRRSEPELEHVIFYVQFNDYLRVLYDLVNIPRTKIV